MRIHGNMESGNCLKVKYLCDFLGTDYEWIDVDVFKGEARTPEFRKLNPHGKTPTLELDDGCTLGESNAILCFLAEGSELFPRDTFTRAKVLQWMFFEQNVHLPGLAFPRFITRFLPADDEHRKQLPTLQEKGKAALAIVDGELATRDWMAGDAFSIADIALYPYTAMAEEGGVSLEEFAAVRRWLDRVARKLELK